MAISKGEALLNDPRHWRDRAEETRLLAEGMASRLKRARGLCWNPVLSFTMTPIQRRERPLARPLGTSWPLGLRIRASQEMRKFLRPGTVPKNVSVLPAKSGAI